MGEHFEVVDKEEPQDLGDDKTDSDSDDNDREELTKKPTNNSESVSKSDQKWEEPESEKKVIALDQPLNKGSFSSIYS